MSDTNQHSESEETPLYEYIDLEAYDVVPGPQYRKLVEQLEALNSENAKLNAENRDLLEKWSARGDVVDAARALIDGAPHTWTGTHLSRALARLDSIPASEPSDD